MRRQHQSRIQPPAHLPISTHTRVFSKKPLSSFNNNRANNPKTLPTTGSRITGQQPQRRYGRHSHLIKHRVDHNRRITTTISRIIRTPTSRHRRRHRHPFTQPSLRINPVIRHRPPVVITTTVRQAGSLNRPQLVY